MDNLIKLRKENNMSQSELANKLGVSQQTVSKYEKGTREPDIATLLKLADILNTTTDYLLGRSSDNEGGFCTIAAHHNGDEWTEEDKELLNKIKKMVLDKKQNKDK